MSTIELIVIHITKKSMEFLHWLSMEFYTDRKLQFIHMHVIYKTYNHKTHTSTHIHKHIHTDTQAQTCTQAHKHKHVHKHTNKQTQTDTQTHIQTHSHTTNKDNIYIYQL